MYAIVEIAGQQFKVEEGRKIYVHRLEAAEGDNVEFEKVLLLDNEGTITVGEPVIPNTVVSGRVIAHVRGDKVIVFKKKRRKGYQKRTGHRQDFTHVEIVSIGAAGDTARKPAARAAVAPAAEPVKSEEPAVTPVSDEKPAARAVKAAAAKETGKPAAKAPAAKAAAAKKPAGQKEPAKKAPAKSTKKPDKE